MGEKVMIENNPNADNVILTINCHNGEHTLCNKPLCSCDCHIVKCNDGIVRKEIIEVIVETCQHLCKNCGAIFSHGLTVNELHKCTVAEITICSRCSSYNVSILENPTPIERDGFRINPYNDAMKICAAMSLEEIEAFIIERNDMLLNLKSEEMAGRKTRTNKIQEMKEQGFKIDKDDYLVFSASRAKEKKEKEETKKLSKLEVAIEKYMKMGFSKAKAEKTAKMIMGMD